MEGLGTFPTIFTCQIASWKQFSLRWPGIAFWDHLVLQQDR